MDSICPNVNRAAQQQEELNLDPRQASEDSMPQVSAAVALLLCFIHAQAHEIAHGPRDGLSTRFY